MSQQRSLRVGYLNVRGLTRRKWATLQPMIGSRWDLLFVGEHWFVDRSWFLEEPEAICSTVLRPHRRSRVGHHPGGVALFAIRERPVVNPSRSANPRRVGTC